MTIDSAGDYQRQTFYSRTEMSGQGMDWDNKPNPYKSYRNAPSTALPRELVLPKADSLSALKNEIKRPDQPLTLTGISNLLFMSYGFTAQVDYQSEVFLYRSAPSAGALYPDEVYLSALGIEGLEDGLYHYSLIDFTLTRLRTGPPPQGLPAPALILTSMFFRSAWKYRERAFRYCLLDTGHLAENFCLTGPALGFTTEPLFDFDDQALNQYLNLDPEKETVLAVIRLREEAAAGEATAHVSDQDFPGFDPVARHEEVFTSIVDAVRVTAAPLGRLEVRPLPDSGRSIDLKSADWSEFSGPTLVQALQKRRSARNFRPKTLMENDLARFLELLLPRDFPQPCNLGFIANEVQDLSDGFYRIHGQGRKISLVKGGFIGPNLAHAALGQDWVGRANLILVVSAPLDLLEAQAGPRSYRLAYLTAGRLGQKAYLAAEALGWGCCGVGAFFDLEIQTLLEMPPDEYPLYLLPVGPIKKRTHGGRPSAR